MSGHLLLDLSSHGFGHLAQSAPVINALRARRPELRLTVRGDFPRALLARRLQGDFELIRDGTRDVGMAMASAIDVLPEESARRYRVFHRCWAKTLRDEAADLARLRPSLVVSNVPYLTLAAAAEAGIRAFALSSLNWAAVFHHYCRDLPDADVIRAQALEAYASAERFLRVEPALPMAELSNAQPIGPVAGLGRNRRSELAERLGLDVRERLALVALGGIDTDLPVARWPVTSELTWLVPPEWVEQAPGRSDLRPFPSPRMPFLDVLASCDVVITKPGYGTFAEAACNGVPVIYVRRGDWPETPYLTAWLHRHAEALALERERVWAGDVVAAVEALLARPRREPPPPRGVEQAAALLDAALESRPSG